VQPEPPYRIFLGADARETRAVAVADASLRQHSTTEIEVAALSRDVLGTAYHRPTTTMPNGQYYDEISDAPMSTDHAIARFFVPWLCSYKGWALFTDGDVLFRADVRQVFAMADDRYAVKVVKHPPLLVEGQKKDGHIQQAYPRKNWSSVVLWNCGHPANRALTLDVLNAWPGRDLHAFRWLDDALIGELPTRWNYLEGLSPRQRMPSLVHFTLGTPDLPGHEDGPFADEWRAFSGTTVAHDAV
jgi:hypothetical protein